MKKKWVAAMLAFALALPVAAFAERKCVTNEGFVGAIFESDFDRVVKCLSQNDTAAAMTFITAKRAFFIEAGVPVIVEDTKILSGKVCLRIPGNPTQFWTSLKAIKCTD